MYVRAERVQGDACFAVEEELFLPWKNREFSLYVCTYMYMSVCVCVGYIIISIELLTYYLH